MLVVVLTSIRIEYAKKKDKKAEVKFIKDETVQRGDIYKSHTVRVPSGEPPNSVSRPPAKRKPGVVRPITQGKLLKAGGPSVGSSVATLTGPWLTSLQKKPAGATVSRPKPIAQPLPGHSTPAAPVQPIVKSACTPVAKQATSTAGSTVPRAPPPPPRAVAPPAEPETPMYKAKYAFEGQEGEMSLQKDDLVELVQKDDNGWWLVKKDGAEGWAPNNYLELVPPKVTPAAPPPPPRTRPVPTPTAPKVLASSVAADASAKPVSVFPGMVPANGSAAPWKKSGTSETPASVRAPPPVASKPKPAPPVAAKPASPKPPVGGKPVTAKPPIPAAVRPTPVPSNKPKMVGQPSMIGGQMDLAAAVSSKVFNVSCLMALTTLRFFLAGEASTTWIRRLTRMVTICFVNFASCSNVNFEWIQYKYAICVRF